MSAAARISVRAPGTIERFTLLSCSGSAPFCESLKAAVHRSDPFPRPEFEELYGDTLVITFE